MNRNLRFLCRGALVAALYVVLTWLCALVGLDKGVIQLRLSEALCVLPAFTGAAVPGLFVGCLLANLLTGSALPDVVFGSLATLIGALGAYLLCRRKWLVPLPTVLANALIIPFVLRFAYGAEGTIPYFMLTVGAGEVISAYICGMLLYAALVRQKAQLFK
ncbi:MAG: QueT transporter family protein [Clostridiales bacterium]|nr:QueT transporter family protein [Clostridiales bacterium]